MELIFITYGIESKREIKDMGAKTSPEIIDILEKDGYTKINDEYGPEIFYEKNEDGESIIAYEHKKSLEN